MTLPPWLAVGQYTHHNRLVGTSSNPKHPRYLATARLSSPHAAHFARKSDSATARSRAIPAPVQRRRKGRPRPSCPSCLMLVAAELSFAQSLGPGRDRRPRRVTRRRHGGFGRMLGRLRGGGRGEGGGLSGGSMYAMDLRQVCGM